MTDADNDNFRRKQLGGNKWQHKLQALYEVLDMLGEPAKKTLLYVMEHEYGINFSESRCSPPEQIESALTSILGPSAEIIIARWKEKMN